MPVPRATRKLIENGNIEALEDEWLARLEAEPGDLDYFVGTARSLASSGYAEAARQLLELLDEHLCSEGMWSERLSLLEASESLLLDPPTLHEAILSSVRALFPDSEIREGLIEKVGLHRAVHDVKKTWRKVAKLRGLLPFRRDAVVLMDGKGPGTIDDVNIELEKFRVALDGMTVTVGFGAAAKVLRPVADDSFFAHKIRKPEALQSIAESDPAELLRLCLEAQKEPVSAATIRDAVKGLIATSSWASWWATARTNPQLVTTGKGARQLYSWAASEDEASNAAREQFERADLDHKLEIYRREAKKDPKRERAMRASLLAIADAADPTQAGTKLRIGMALAQGGASDLGDAAPSAVIAAHDDPAALIASIDDKATRRRALALLKETRDDSTRVFAELLVREEEPRILSDLAEAVAEADPEALTAAFDAIVAHPRRRAGAFVWLAENLPSFPFLEDRNPLRLMQLILRAETGREFRPFRSRLRKLISSAETLPHLIAGLRAEQAEQAEHALSRAPVEEYVRQPLINALHLRFPETFKRTENVLYALPASIDARREELRELLEVEIPANRRAIEHARELGDLRENFEYKSARQRHEYLAARAGALDADLRRARAIDLSQVESTEVRIGCRVELADKGETKSLTILGPWESEPEEGVLSYESATAGSLLGKAPKSEVEIEGRTWTIARIDRLDSEA